MHQINAAVRLKAAKAPTKKTVQNWLIKHYGFQPGHSQSNPFSKTANDYGVIKDPAKVKALVQALEQAGFKKDTQGLNPGNARYILGDVMFQIQKGGYVWTFTPKKAKPYTQPYYD